MSAEQQETQGGTDGVRNGDGGHVELGTDLKCQNRGEQATDSKSADGGYRAGNDAGSGEDQLERAYDCLTIRLSAMSAVESAGVAPRSAAMLPELVPMLRCRDLGAILVRRREALAWGRQTSALTTSVDSPEPRQTFL